MFKQYIEVELYKANVKHEKEYTAKDGSKFTKCCVSLPKIGPLWVSKTQISEFEDKKPNGEKVSKIVLHLGAETNYEFFRGQDVPMEYFTGKQIMDFYQKEWKDSKNRSKDEQTFVSTKMVEKELKKENNSELVVDQPQEKKLQKTKTNSKTISQ